MPGFSQDQFPKLVKEGLVAYEGFAAGLELTKAKAAWTECKEEARRAAESVRTAETLLALAPAHKQRVTEWFGLKPSVPSHQNLYEKLRRNLLTFHSSILSRPVTLVNRPDMMYSSGPVHASNSFDEGKKDIYGYVHWQVAGTGMRVICCKLFLTDPTPYYASTTIYHELTHKLFTTKDHGYGADRCQELATTSPATAIDNADSYAYYVISLFP